MMTFGNLECSNVFKIQRKKAAWLRDLFLPLGSIFRPNLLCFALKGGYLGSRSLLFRLYVLVFFLVLFHPSSAFIVIHQMVAIFIVCERRF